MKPNWFRVFGRTLASSWLWIEKKNLHNVLLRLRQVWIRFSAGELFVRVNCLTATNNSDWLIMINPMTQIAFSSVHLSRSTELSLKEKNKSNQLKQHLQGQGWCRFGQMFSQFFMHRHGHRDDPSSIACPLSQIWVRTFPAG